MKTSRRSFLRSVSVIAAMTSGLRGSVAKADPVVWQMHHVYSNGKHDLIAQFSETELTQAEWNAWWPGIQARHPLPPGCTWVAVREDNPKFQRALVHHLPGGD